MQTLKSFAEGLAEDTAIDKFNELAEKYIKTKNPYIETLPDGSTRKLKLPASATKQEQKQWKKIQKRAWLDDKCFMGCYPVDCGCGLGPIMVILPGIGPYLMYLVHLKLIQMAVSKFHIDAATQAKLHANIIFDLLITLPPVIGSFFAWLNGCSTRNAAIIHTEIRKQLLEREGTHEQQTVPIENVDNRPNVNHNNSGNLDISQANGPEQQEIRKASMNQQSRPYNENLYGNMPRKGLNTGQRQQYNTYQHVNRPVKENNDNQHKDIPRYPTYIHNHPNRTSNQHYMNRPIEHPNRPLPEIPHTTPTVSRSYSDNPYSTTSTPFSRPPAYGNTSKLSQKKEQLASLNRQSQVADSRAEYYPSSPRQETYHPGTSLSNGRRASPNTSRRPPPGYFGN